MLIVEYKDDIVVLYGTVWKEWVDTYNNNKSYLILAPDLVLNFNTEMYVRCAHLRTCVGPGLDPLR